MKRLPKMKILIIVRVLSASGAQKIAIEEAKTLINMNNNVKLLFLRESKSGQSLKSLLIGTNYEIFANNNYKSKKIFKYITGLFLPDRKDEGTLDLDLISNFVKKFNKSDAELIICHDSWAGIVGYKLYKKYNIPYVVYCHEAITGIISLPILGHIARWIEKKVLKNALKLYGVTKKVADSEITAYGYECIPNFPGMDQFTNSNINDFNHRSNILLASATWDKDRNPMQYLEIIKKLDGFKLYIVGRWRDSDYLENFEDIISKNNPINKILIKPYIPEDELQMLYASCKFSIRFGATSGPFGSGESGVGTSNIEAINNLTPIIINPEIGISDLIMKNGGGMVVNSTCIDEIVSFINRNNNYDNYSKLQVQLRNIKNIYTWKNHCELLLSYHL